MVPAPARWRVRHRHHADLWTDLVAIRQFAGIPEGVAKYYDFDAQFLLEMTERVQHFDIIEE